MKVLFTSDLHLKKNLVEGVMNVAIREEVDVVVNTGDFLSNEFANYFAKLIHENGIKGFFIEGNWDNGLSILYDSVNLLKYSFVKYKRYYFFGVYEKIILSYEDLLEITKGISGSKLIFLTHEPPRGILDKIWNNKNIGSEIYLKFDHIKKPLIHAFGHIHESNGHIKLGDTLYINAAMNDIPRCYTVHLPSLEIKEHMLKK